MNVTVITASFNKAKYISETINSVLSQTHAEIEHIIVDDASTDHTVDLIKEFQKKDKRVKLLVNETNMGGNYCRNRGLQIAKGRYIIFLDADDLLSATCVENRLQMALNNPSNNLLVFSMGVFHKRLSDDNRTWIPTSTHPLKDFLSHKLPWSILQPFWKKDFLHQLSGFDESFQRLQDVELHTRALLHKEVNYKLFASEPDCYYRIDDERRNYDVYTFDLKRIEASLLYYSKFYKTTLEKKLHSILWGTIYTAYLQLIFHVRNKSINREQFVTLEKRLLTDKDLYNNNFLRRSLFKISKAYNLHFPRIPGINFLVSQLIML